MERWKEVPGYDGRYWVSDEGRVKSFATGKERMLKPRPADDGYLKVTFTMHYKQRTFLLHRVVLLAFAGPCPEGFQGNHKDGDPLHNTLDNLEWVTPLGNSQHAWRNGFMHPPRGEAHGMAKLSEAEAIEIKQLLKNGIPHRQLAKRFHVHKSCITHISIGTTWKHI